MKEAGAEAYEMWKGLKDLDPSQLSQEAKDFMADPTFPKSEKTWTSYLFDIDENYDVAATKYNQVNTLFYLISPKNWDI